MLKRCGAAGVNDMPPTFAPLFDFVNYFACAAKRAARLPPPARFAVTESF
ncbi:hypothetical protein [Undibacter mobilis]|nr:hypothetical protein [Undibacter mobilis]